MGQKCVHCGEDCGANPVMWEGKPFCCHGCKTVYQILNEKKLDKYYEIQPMSGIKIEKADVGNKYAFLDLEEIKEKLLDFSDGDYSKVTLFIPTIHCASCIWLLENLHTINLAIVASNVNFPQKKVTITFNNKKITLRELVELLVSIHYVPEITLDQLDKKDKNTSNRELLLKIGVAGFSLMNVMLYNFPEYLPGSEQLGELFTKFFGYMSFALALPVVFYSANDYYLSAIKGLKHKIVNIDVPITLGIFTLFIQSSYDIFTGQGIGYMDSLVGLVFFLLIGKWYQSKTYQALSFERDYKSYFPVAVTIIKDNKETTIPLSKLKEDDVILIRNQELIPADSKLTKGDAEIDYSFVTGESLPVKKKEGELIFAGGRQMGGSIELQVVKKVDQSYLTQLWNQDYNKENQESELNRFVNKISEYFTFAVLTIAFSAGIYWLFKDNSLAIFAFTSVLIIACPCALALTVPFTFGSTMREYGRNGFYLKNTEVIENLRKIDSIVFDKTGTLTVNRSMKVEFEGDKLTKTHLKMIKALVSNSSHPLSITIKENIDIETDFKVEKFREIPSLGITGIINGLRINIGSKKFVTGKDDDEPLSTNVYVFIGDKILGHYKIQNQYRKGLKKVIENLKKKYDLYLLSGDNDSEKKNLLPLFGSEAKLLFNQSPTDKRDFVRDLKKKGKKILMIGDGLNDAGALMESDVGITVADDIYSFSPACDGIIESSKFSILNKFINYSNTAFNIVVISFFISFLYNVIGLSFAVTGTLSPLIAAVLMPISSVSVVVFATAAVKITFGRLFKTK
jgi:Cu+-exporting ATPase